MNKEDLEINVATLLFQYGQQICKKIEVVLGPNTKHLLVKSLLLEDPLFNTTVHSIISPLDQKDNAVDIYQHLSEEQNLQVLDDMNIGFCFNEKSKVAFIRNDQNSIDFYPSTNK